MAIGEQTTASDTMHKTTNDLHHEGRVPPRDIHTSSTPRHFVHIPTKLTTIAHQMASSRKKVCRDATTDHQDSQQRRNQVPYRGSSQRSKTRTRLTTPSPPQHTHSQYTRNIGAVRATLTATYTTHQPGHARHISRLQLATPLLYRLRQHHHGNKARHDRTTA